jgi:hypothetical protein
MNGHLSQEELVAALEGTLEPIRKTHLDACDRCGREAGSLQAILRDVETAAEPAEPSPLFWDHFSARVRDAVGPAPPRVRVWRRWWKPVVALAAGAAAIVLVTRGADRDPATDVVPVQTADAAAATDAPWEAVVELAADLSVDDVAGAVPLRLDNVVLFDELTPEERAAVAELLEHEMKGLE